MNTNHSAPRRRHTIRRYAHELHPEPADGAPGALGADVRYWYARAIGLVEDGTSWAEMLGPEQRTDTRTVALSRTDLLVATRRIALLVDALHQGLAGEAARLWAEQHLTHDEDGEFVGERAAYYGVDWLAIKPYPCGPEPGHHVHYERRSDGWARSSWIEGRESECPDCTEERPQ